MGLPCLAFDEVYTLWHENGTLPQALETAPALRAFPPPHTHTPWQEKLYSCALVENTFNPSTLWAEAEGSLRSRPA